jgi:long-subunit acyl-CoA synthetase (AMP-forming)
MDPDIQNFMKIVFEVPFILGYGLSESNFGSFSSDAVDPNSGHVGGPTVII